MVIDDVLSWAKGLIPMVTPYVFYLFNFIFGGAGMSKLFGSTENLEEGFPALPRWFWRACGAWIMVALVLYDMGVFGLGRNHVLLKEISALMETIFVGGIFYSIFFIKNMSGSNAIAQTKGFVLVPATTALLVCLATVEDIDGTWIDNMHVVGCLALGCFVGALLTATNKNYVSKND
mmetsp:Transcript_12871/g.27802  ORF Transcript_12871/g.27802 Transcript_12871/m.27802 type:complete len:177 (+) Transcript_12871:79-609(+)